jgi:hypothetical protein
MVQQQQSDCKDIRSRSMQRSPTPGKFHFEFHPIFLKFEIIWMAMDGWMLYRESALWRR